MSLRDLYRNVGSFEIQLWIAEFQLRHEDEERAMEEAKKGA